MKVNTRLIRKKRIDFAVGMASIDGGRPSAFTKEMLDKYEKGLITSREVKQGIINKYIKDYE